MGDIADMILMGILCQQCGTPVDYDAVGFPRCCDDCKPNEKEGFEESLTDRKKI